MKNKKKIIIIGLVIFLVVCGAAYLLRDRSNNEQFEKDYDVKVPDGVSIMYLTDENIISELSLKDKLVFLGLSGSEDTTKAVKVLLKVAQDNGVDKIYYYSLTDIYMKDDIVEKLVKKIGIDKITTPTLFLVKDKKVSSVEVGYNKDIKTKYSDIVTEYIMCTTPDC